MSSDFQVGDEVVCVDNKPRHAHFNIEYLKYLIEGEKYTITSLRPATQEGFPDTLLLGINNILWTDGKDFGYASGRFRKVQKNLSGMSVLRGLLNIKDKELVE